MIRTQTGTSTALCFFTDKTGDRKPGQLRFKLQRKRSEALATSYGLDPSALDIVSRSSIFPVRQATIYAPCVLNEPQAQQAAVSETFGGMIFNDFIESDSLATGPRIRRNIF